MSTTKLTNYADPKTGEFNRKPSVFRNAISRVPGAQFPPEKDRYHLYVSYGCPWAHRTLIVRALKGLDEILPVSAVHWHLGERGWRFATAAECAAAPEQRMTAAPEPNLGAHLLRELYLAADPAYEGRFTVPVLWDKKTRTIVSNESADIIRFFYTEFDDLLPVEKRTGAGGGGGDYYPEDLRESIDGINGWIYDGLNNGVYRTGFATTQAAYEAGVYNVFATLDRLEAHLTTTTTTTTSGPYLFGNRLTDADIRLYPTIARFDVVYVQHFKCNLKMVRHDYPAIHRWLRHLYWDVPGFRETTDFETIKMAYTRSQTGINPHSITPVGPVLHVLPKDA